MAEYSSQTDQLMAELVAMEEDADSREKGNLLLGIILLAALVVGLSIALVYVSVRRDPKVLVTSPDGPALPCTIGTLQNAARGVAFSVALALNNYDRTTISQQIMLAASHMAPGYRERFVQAVKKAVSESQNAGEVKTFSVDNYEIKTTSATTWDITVTGHGYVGLLQGSTSPIQTGGFPAVMTPYTVRYVVTISLANEQFWVTAVQTATAS